VPRSFLPSAALLTLALVVGACSESTGPGAEPITELPRELSVSEREVVERSNVFGLGLLRQVAAADDRPNVVLSPLSASMALGMTLNGAREGTFAAMRETLGFGTMSQEEINGAYRDLIELLSGLDPDVRFTIANGIWANEDVTFRDAFFDAVADAFDAETRSSDFGDPATLEQINGWVEDRTEGYIDEILESLDPDLVMLLVNAIYFDGAWTTRFDPERTAPGTFLRADGSEVTADMMSMSDAEVSLGGGPDHQAAELPYGGGAFAMTIVVPSGDVREFVAGLDEARWSSIVDGLGAPSEIDLLSLPKLEVAYDAWLNDALRAMGMEVAFTDAADFTGMSEEGGLCIDFVRQKTFLQVDEAGTKAAAATAVGVRPTAFNGFVVDRPFVLAIRERLSGSLLFVGVIGDPTVGDAPEPEPQEGCGA